ncbi:phage tail protein (plasmid) [Raoultella ornithinolytica]|uniref:phage tail protein n=1 Tax=Raoultella ornithinolytica TaxID=54291 RepID=UPI00292AECD2|nr:phage tail protein [Raoultella ornithinolytica]MDV1094961.1 phage tail protein [Raoultella ornithinolytica]MDV1122695.1 phage tail protein [Raoultella ornithinolytica]MDV1893210.1 phage tail protein [Raoultella ornithinolytica]
MNKIDFSVGQAAGVAVAAVNADATLTNTSGGASVFAGLVVARRGAPGKVLAVSASTYKSVLGTPIHPRMGATFEPYRHIERAVKGGTGYVVRVCPSDMKVPAIVIPKPAPKGHSDKPLVKPAKTEVNAGDQIQVRVEEKPGSSVSCITFAPTEIPALPEGALAVIYIKDGDASESRTLSLEPQEDSDLFTLTLKETLPDGSVDILETHQVSFNPEASSDMGDNAWMPTVLDGQSIRLGAELADNAETIAKGAEFKDIAFEGGSDGTLSKIASADYLKALETLEDSTENFTAVLSLGCYDPTVLAALNNLAEAVRVDMFYDALGNQTADAAMKEVEGHGFGGSHQPARYYFPFSCRDTFTSMNVVYGISCDAFVAKAKGIAMIPDVGGWHFSPAGVSRGIIDRQNIAKIPNLGVVDRQAFVKARINPVTVSANGDVYIDDALTTFTKNNYLRFQHVSSLMNAIARGFYEVAQAIKHEPDGVTQKSLTDGMTDLLERFYAAGALVTPRDKTQGTQPFVVSVTQKEIDYWQVEWAVCPTGSARRIVGKPILMR